MTDQDYIKAAVELADGFAPDALQISSTEDMQIGFEEQFFLDALAAQLARQTYEKWNDTGKAAEFVYQTDPMDTIKEIIDDGWLDES